MGMATEPSAIETAIASQAVQPASASADGVSVTNRSIDDLIKADRYAKGEQARRSKTLGLRFTKINPPGPVG